MARRIFPTVGAMHLMVPIKQEVNKLYTPRSQIHITDSYFKNSNVRTQQLARKENTCFNCLELFMRLHSTICAGFCAHMMPRWKYCMRNECCPNNQLAFEETTKCIKRGLKGNPRVIIHNVSSAINSTGL